MSTQRNAPLDYADPELATRGPVDGVIAMCAAVLYLVVTILALFTGGLHNDFPFLRPAIFVGILSLITLVGARHFVLRSGNARIAAIIWFASTSLLGLISHQVVYGQDPHVTTRRNHYCLTRLRSIGQALLMYANDNRGAYPDSLADLVQATPDWESQTFICPAVVPYGTPGPSRDRLIADLKSGANAQHVYLAKGLTDRCPPNTILVYDNPLNWSQHGGGMSILFANGESRHLEKRDANKVLAALQAGQNPPPPGTISP